MLASMRRKILYNNNQEWDTNEWMFVIIPPFARLDMPNHFSTMAEWMCILQIIAHRKLFVSCYDLAISQESMM